MDEEANGDSLKEGTNFVVGEGNSSSYELEAFIAFLLSRHLFERYPYEKILSKIFPIVSGYPTKLFLTMAHHS